MCLYEALFIPPEFPPAAHVDRDLLPAFLRREAMSRLTALKRMVGDISCEILVEESGSPWVAILGAADRWQADLIVLGSHGYTMIDHFLGTTAAKVANHADRSVLVVHVRKEINASV